MPIIIVLPGVIGFYYFGDSLYESQDLVYPELVKKVLPLSFTGFFAAVVMGAVLSTFNSVLNSAATIFSVDVYKRHINKKATERRLVVIGKSTSTILAVTAIITAPFVANAPEGLYQLLQQLNGIFFIPIASIMLAGFFTKNISATGAKLALFVGLAFYITATFILDVDIHFVHIWGIEFLLNVTVMFLVSRFYPVTRDVSMKSLDILDLTEWKYAKMMSVILVIVTILIYVLLGNV